MDFVDTRRPNSIIAKNHLSDHPDLPAHVHQGAALQRNKTERVRLQGLQRTLSATERAARPNNNLAVDETTLVYRWKRWMINEGGRQLFFGAFILLHLIAGVFGYLHYQLKDNLTQARATFGAGFTIARTSALLCHIDVIFILLPICRNFISIMRRTPLGTVIPFDKNITFHK
ncbi:hypothetical protein V5O48_017255, partial [Marasmius crinis-equi]